MSPQNKDKTILAIDPGTKFCGLAICKNGDAYPVKTLRFNNDFQKLNILLTQELINIKPSIILIGYPDYGKMQGIIKKHYIPIIRNFIKQTQRNIKVILIDESDTTKLATTYANFTHQTSHNITNVTGLYHKQGKNKMHGIIDKASALMLLYKAHEKGIIVCN